MLGNHLTQLFFYSVLRTAQEFFCSIRILIMHFWNIFPVAVVPTILNFLWGIWERLGKWTTSSSSISVPWLDEQLWHESHSCVCTDPLWSLKYAPLRSPNSFLMSTSAKKRNAWMFAESQAKVYLSQAPAGIPAFCSTVIWMISSPALANLFGFGTQSVWQIQFITSCRTTK